MVEVVRDRLPRAMLPLLAVLALLGLPKVGGLPLVALALKLSLTVVVVGLFARWAEGAVIALVAFLPLQQALLSLAFRLGAPSPIVRGLGLCKEAVVAALVIFVLRLRANRGPADRLDRLALIYIGVVSLYVILPALLPGAFAAHLSLTTRLYAWRVNVLFVVMFYCCRRLDLSASRLRALRAVIVLVAAISAACALIELLWPTAWSNFLIHGLGIREFRQALFNQGQISPDELVHTRLAGRDVVRVGSLAFSPIVLGFQLLPAFGLAASGVLEGRRLSRRSLTLALLATAVMATLTRSAVLAAGLSFVLVLQLGIQIRARGRIAAVVSAVLALVIFGPFVGASAIGQRTSSAFNGDVSAQGHRENSLRALGEVIAHPLGLGLGTNPSTGQRFKVAERVTSENAYLQVGAELGLVAMALFICLVLACIVSLRRRALHADDGGLARGTFAALGGLALGGMFLHVWLDFTTALTMWSLAGCALPARGTRAGQLPEPALARRVQPRGETRAASPIESPVP